MKCKACQEKILLHDTLLPAEVTAMHAHITQCAACQLVWQETLTFQKQLADARQFTVAPSPMLTDRIMTAVMHHQATHISHTWWETLIYLPVARLLLSGVAIALMLFFLWEWKAPSFTKLEPKTTNHVHAAILKHPLFRQEDATKEKRKSWLSSCIDNTKKQADLACLREKIKSIQF